MRKTNFLLIGILVLLTNALFAQVSNTDAVLSNKKEAEDFLRSELGSTHSVLGWPEQRSDWFIRENYKDQNGKDQWRFLEIYSYSSENEYLILKVREAFFVSKSTGGSAYVLGTPTELLINLYDSLTYIEDPHSKKTVSNKIVYKNYEIDHRGEASLDKRYKKDRNFDATMIKELYKYLHILKSDVDSNEKADVKLMKFKNEVAGSNYSKEVSEEQRKYIVQANAANDAHDYIKALQLYRKSLEINRYSYPAAFFNMSLILAQINCYYQAIFSMKAYLILMPDAEDSRKAQDKIYEWELNLK